jgi:hypothetical protein
MREEVQGRVASSAVPAAAAPSRYAGLLWEDSKRSPGLVRSTDRWELVLRWNCARPDFDMATTWRQELATSIP